MAELKLYGVPFSQPVRAVLWLLLLKRKAFDLVLINPGSSGEKGSRHPDYLARNPAGTIPCLELADGFTLGEAHAIMTFLARTEGWTDLYPQDERLRARIDQYLHYHHRNVREASTGLVAPRIRKDLDIPEVIQASAARSLSGALHMLESYPLAEGAYIVGDQLTLADIAAYAEIGQLQPCFTNLFDFSAYPRVQQWLDRMQAVEYHDVLHAALSVLGDISTTAPDMDTIKLANKQALRALGEAQASW